LYWHQVWGISGLFLAMPLMAALKAICMQVQGWQGWGHLMGSGPAVELQIDSPQVEKARLEEIERGAAANDQTVRMDAPQKGAAQPGDSKSYE
jgi:AI-2 transport protein TqsA